MTDSKTEKGNVGSSLVLAVLRALASFLLPFLILSIVLDISHLHFCGAMGRLTSGWTENVQPLLRDIIYSALQKIGVKTQLPAILIDYIIAGVVMLIAALRSNEITRDLAWIVRYRHSVNQDFLVTIISTVMATIFYIVSMMLFWPIFLLVMVLTYIPYLGRRLEYRLFVYPLEEKDRPSFQEFKSSEKLQASMRRGRRAEILVAAPTIAITIAMIVSQGICRP